MTFRRFRDLVPVIFAVGIVFGALFAPGCGGSSASEQVWRFDQAEQFVFDPEVVALDATGAQLKGLPDGECWTAVYQDPRPNRGPEYHGLTFDVEGNLVVTGTVADFNTNRTSELILCKYDRQGQAMPGWPVLYADPGYRWNEAHDAAVDAAGNIWIVGYAITWSEQWCLAVWKFDASGNLQPGWPRYPLASHAYGTGIIIDAAGDIVACGSYGQKEGMEVALVKYGPDGTPAEGWPKTYLAEGSVYDFAYGLIQDAAGYLVVAGFAGYGGGGRDAALFKFSDNGDPVPGWPVTWDSGAGLDEYYSVSQDAGGDYCVTGIARSASEDDGILLLSRFDTQGQQLTSSGWPVVYEGGGVRDWSPPDAWGGCVDSSGCIASAGTYQSDTHVVTVRYTTEAEMSPGFPRVWDNPGYFDVTRACGVDGLDNVYTVGFSHVSGSDADYTTWVVKYPPGAYSTGRPPVTVKQGLKYAELAGFSEQLGEGSQGSVTYQLSPDGTAWYYHNGTSWVSASGKNQANTAPVVDANIADFAGSPGGGTLYVRAFLASDGTQATVLESVTVEYR